MAKSMECGVTALLSRNFSALPRRPPWRAMPRHPQGASPHPTRYSLRENVLLFNGGFCWRGVHELSSLPAPAKPAASDLGAPLYTPWVISHHFCGADIQKQSCFVTTYRSGEKG